MKITKWLLFMALYTLLASCTGHKSIAYLQNATILDSIEVVPSLYDARIMPKDLIIITVSTTDGQASVPFNLTVPTVLTTTTKYLTSQPSIQQYLVDNSGEIEFPVLGKLQIGGMTKSEVEQLIREKLSKYLNEVPIVNVRMTNYNVSVLGEVTKPGTFTIDNEKVNVLEALAMAGDLTIYGERNNVKLIREDEKGNRKIISLDLNDAQIIVSPYYYLQQNDVLYVTPNKTKAKNTDISTSTTIWFSVASTLLSTLSLVFTIVL